MQFLNDTYTIQAGDAAAVFAGRGYNVALGRWETLAGVNLTPTAIQPRKYKLRSVDIRVYHASGAIASGVRIWIATVADPLHTEMVIPVIDEVQSISKTVAWAGDLPLGAGLIWRIPLAGVIATDYVGIGAVYE